MKASRPSDEGVVLKNPGQARRRADMVAAGRCGQCGKPRNKFQFLCDDCAEKHKERQRAKRVKDRAHLEEYGDAD